LRAGGAYALSGAGLIRPLPWLRAGIVVIGVIYVLRGLMLPSEITQVVQGSRPFRFLVFSSGSLAIGLLYLFGVWTRS
jgi:hypothetical protein